MGSSRTCSRGHPRGSPPGAAASCPQSSPWLGHRGPQVTARLAPAWPPPDPTRQRREGALTFRQVHVDHEVAVTVGHWGSEPSQPLCTPGISGTPAPKLTQEAQLRIVHHEVHAVHFQGLGILTTGGPGKAGIRMAWAGSQPPAPSPRGTAQLSPHPGHEAQCLALLLVAQQ